MQGDQRNQPGQGLDYPGVGGYGVGIGLATVGDPMTDGEYLPAGDGVFELVPDLLEGLGVTPIIGSDFPIALT